MIDINDAIRFMISFHNDIGGNSDSEVALGDSEIHDRIKTDAVDYIELAIVLANSRFIKDLENTKHEPMIIGDAEIDIKSNLNNSELRHSSKFMLPDLDRQHMIDAYLDLRNMSHTALKYRLLRILKRGNIESLLDLGEMELVNIDLTDLY